MKQSLIITLIICVFLGESFSLIVKKDNQKTSKPTTYCCKKVCNESKDNKTDNIVQPDAYMPMVNMLRYNL